MSSFRVIPADRAGGRRIVMGAEMQAADRRAIEGMGIPSLGLMENAGRHVAVEAAVLCPPGRPVAVLSGRGNNGGDGLVAARHLADWGFEVDVYVCGPADRTTPDTAIQLRAVMGMGLAPRFLTERDDFQHLPIPGHYGLVIDGLLGTGLSGTVRGLISEGIAWINGHGASVLAVDIASGLCADTGQILGSAVRATATVTFAASKMGHWMFPGAAHTGRLVVADIGLPLSALAPDVPDRRILTSEVLGLAFARRPRDGHKGTFGHVYVLAGSPGRTGAARMAGDAALRSGAGLVTLGTTREAFRMLGGELYELMSEVALEPGQVPISAAERLSDRLNRCQAAVIGPGLPAESEVGEVLAHLLPRLAIPVVVDAEALNQLARRKDVFEGAGPRILTPHPGEAARLLGRSTAEIQADRVGAALTLADETDAVVVLKGAHTVVATPDGRVGLCPDGNPGMGSPGMGDVLAGVLGALLARGLPAAEAAFAGVVWHARAADRAAAASSESALTARDVIQCLVDVERAPC